MEYVTLANGIEMPVLGYGVYQIPKEETEACVLNALQTGYRSIDTAQAYGNEEEVGSAIIKSGIPRQEIFLTSKVWISDYGYDACRASVLRSLEKLQTDYIDLMLLHQPFNDTYGAWRALEDLYDEGKLRAIGVSNFYPDRLIDFCAFNRIKPMVNQVEAHLLFQQPEAKAFMDKYGVVMEAWAPLAQANKELLEEPLLIAIGEKYRKTPAQLALRWNIDRGVVVIPKTTSPERMAENFDVLDFKLSEGEMVSLEALDKKKSLFLSHTDPDTVEMFITAAKPAEEEPISIESPVDESIEPTAPVEPGVPAEPIDPAPEEPAAEEPAPAEPTETDLPAE
ncbi:MAG: aldo/keto reductase [Solobacterium sp.]|nr:aldo/keto reductase [Solobacterium sp.]